MICEHRHTSYITLALNHFFVDSLSSPSKTVYCFLAFKGPFVACRLNNGCAELDALILTHAGQSLLNDSRRLLTQVHRLGIIWPLVQLSFSIKSKYCAVFFFLSMLHLRQSPFMQGQVANAVLERPTSLKSHGNQLAVATGHIIH